MQDTSSAANHRRSDRAHQTNGLGAEGSSMAGLDGEDETWFEVLTSPPVDKPLITLVPVRRGPSAG